MTAMPWHERLAELAGPIAVKEVRQGLRTQVFAVFFSVLLVACLALALVGWVQATEASERDVGQLVFGANLTALGVVGFFVVPFGAFRSMVREREQDTWALLALTGLGPRSVLRGKWVSAQAQALLSASACAPFVVFSYFLNGVGLLQVVVALALAAVWSGFLTAVAVALGTQGRALLPALAVLLLGTAWGVGWAWGIARDGEALAYDHGLQGLVLGVGLFGVAVSLLLLEAGAAALMLPTEPASRGPRLHLVGCTGLAWGFGVAAFLLADGSAAHVLSGQVLTTLFLTAAGVFAVSERDGYTAASARGPRWLVPGAVRSYWLVLALLAGSTVVWGTLMSWGGGALHGESKHERALYAAPLYAALYLSLAAAVGRARPLASLGETLATRVAFFASVPLAVVASTGLSLAVSGRDNHRLSHALDPVVGMVNFATRSGRQMDAALWGLVGATFLSVVLGAAVLAARDGSRPP